MMFDPKTKEEADRLEAEGDLIGAWGVLSEEWMSHTDIDYYDDEMAIRIHQWICDLFDRNPGMVEQRVQMKLMEMGSMHYWGLHNAGTDAAEEAMRIARESGRADLELEALDSFGSIQSQRYGGIRNMPGYAAHSKYRDDVMKRLEESDEQ